MLTLHHISYLHINGERLFGPIDLSLHAHEKAGLTGHNGAGKSTLLKIIAGQLMPSEGQVMVKSKPYYLPQLFGQYDHLSIAEALNVHQKLNALQEILAGQATEHNLELLDDDWSLEERCRQALEHWQLSGLRLTQPVGSLSGGQKTRVLLAGITLHQPELVLLDEPSNQLDRQGRDMLYDLVRHAPGAFLVVSHDRALLNLTERTLELGKQGLDDYGGNYAFYAAQKQLQQQGLEQDIQSAEQALRKAREKERETAERQQKLNARGKQKQEKAGIARIMMNTLKNNAEKSTAKLKATHAENTGKLSQELQVLRMERADLDNMKLHFEQAGLPKGKLLFAGDKINYAYEDDPTWKKDLEIRISSGERIALQGGNGAGKTTLLRVMLGQLQVTTGSIQHLNVISLYIDQEYSIMHSPLSVYEQAQRFNSGALQEHEVKIRLSRFLFSKNDWDKPCDALSGGERMRLLLCCMSLNQRAPDLLVLDEPTNNLDLQSVEILTAALRSYQGTLIVVSHDALFLEEIGIGRSIWL